jgi:glycosyltransferase involved in cell wall biosynthesis
MRIVFLAAIGPGSSTLTGRTLPLARRLSFQHEVHVVCLADGSSFLPSKSEAKKKNDNSFSSSSGGKVKMWVAGPALVTKNQSGKKTYPPRLLPTIACLEKGWRGLLRHLKKLAPHLIVIVKTHPQNMLATLFYLQKCAPAVVLDLDDDEYANPLLKNWQRWLLTKLENRLQPKLAAVWVASPLLLQQRRARVAKTMLLPTGINLPLRTQPLPIPRKPCLAYLGTLSRHTGHNLDLLFQAMRKIIRVLPTTTLEVWGRGENLDHYRLLARQQGIEKNTIFRGGFLPHQSEKILRSTTVLADPTDNTPVSAAKSSYRVTEALRCGVPVVAGAVGIRKQLLAKVGSYCLVKPGASDQLAERLIWHLQHPTWRYEFWSATRDTARAIHWDSLAAKVLRELPALLPSPIRR